MAAGKDYLGPLAALPDFHDHGLNSIVQPVALKRQLLLLGQDPLNPAQIDNYIAVFKTAHRSRDYIVNPIQKIAVNLRPFRLPDSLNNYLFGGLSGNAPEFPGSNLYLNQVSQLAARIINPGFVELHLLMRQLHLIDYLKL